MNPAGFIGDEGFEGESCEQDQYRVAGEAGEEVGGGSG